MRVFCDISSSNKLVRFDKKTHIFLTRGRGHRLLVIVVVKVAVPLVLVVCLVFFELLLELLRR
jgi:hypothetical protein